MAEGRLRERSSAAQLGEDVQVDGQLLDSSRRHLQVLRRRDALLARRRRRHRRGR